MVKIEIIINSNGTYVVDAQKEGNIRVLMTILQRIK